MNSTPNEEWNGHVPQNVFWTRDPPSSISSTPTLNYLLPTRRTLWTRDLPSSRPSSSRGPSPTIEWMDPDVDLLWSAIFALQREVTSLKEELKKQKTVKMYIRPEVVYLRPKNKK